MKMLLMIDVFSGKVLFYPKWATDGEPVGFGNNNGVILSMLFCCLLVCRHRSAIMTVVVAHQKGGGDHHEGSGPTSDCKI